jgi:hypothetical protein
MLRRQVHTPSIGHRWSGLDSVNKPAGVGSLHTSLPTEYEKSPGDVVRPLASPKTRSEDLETGDHSYAEALRVRIISLGRRVWKAWTGLRLHLTPSLDSRQNFFDEWEWKPSDRNWHPREMATPRKT